MAGPRKHLVGGKEMALVKKNAQFGKLSKVKDILISASSEDTLRYHRLRASLPSNLWVWRTVCGWKWKGSKETYQQPGDARGVVCLTLAHLKAGCS